MGASESGRACDATTERRRAARGETHRPNGSWTKAVLKDNTSILYTEKQLRCGYFAARVLQKQPRSRSHSRRRGGVAGADFPGPESALRKERTEDALPSRSGSGSGVMRRRKSRSLAAATVAAAAALAMVTRKARASLAANCDLEDEVTADWEVAEIGRSADIDLRPDFELGLDIGL